MKKWGNSFDYLTCSQLFEGKRAYDWLTAGGKMDVHFRIKMLDYRDWDFYAIIAGMVTITKKCFIRQIKWNEARFWNDYEDIQLSLEYHYSGLLGRVNPKAKMTSLGFRHGIVPFKRYFPYETWLTIIPQNMYLRSIIRFFLSLLSRIPFMLKTINFLYEKVFKNSRIYQKIIKSS
ncbi:MAG: hypothetical protein HY810_02385 [Candidatus Omnitrophica bacterium]|nr:hypothetical protein [Candidatus Omnitrophota bacterium]